MYRSATCLVGKYVIVVIVHVTVIVQCKLQIELLKGKSSIMLRIFKHTQFTEI